MHGNFKIVLLLSLLLNMTSTMAQPMSVVPSPAAGASAPGLPSQLTYKNFALPLTIGEMSSLQAKKLDEDFLRKLGYTSTPVAIAAPPPKLTASQRKAATDATSKPRDVIVAVGIYGQADKPSADLVVNGLMISVKAGSSLPKGLAVQAITSKSIEILVPSKVKGGSPSVQSVSAGEMLELEQ